MLVAMMVVTGTLASPALLARTPRARTAASTTPAPEPTRIPLAMGISLIEGNTARSDDDLDALDAFAARSGRMPASFSIWSDWGGDNSAFPSRALLSGLRGRGVRPVIFWQPVGKDWRTRPERYAYERIVAGDWDAYLTAWARDAAAWGDRVIVRWAHEMNAPWFPWAIGKVGNTPEGYRAAWRHVVTLVRGIAPNVRFMWAPNAPCGTCVAYADLFPGDASVDLVGFDIYAWKPGDLAPMVELYRPAMLELRALTALPVVVAETGAAGPSDARAAWLSEGLPAIAEAYPELVGFIYFDIDMRVTDDPDWRLSEDDGTLEAWATLAADPPAAGILDPTPEELAALPTP